MLSRMNKKLRVSLLAMAVVAAGASPAFAKTINFSVNLSKSVTIGDTGTLPKITVKTATGKTYTLTATNALGATGVTALTFNFSVAAGDFAPAGLTVDALTVGTATLTDSAGNSLASVASGWAQTVAAAKVQTYVPNMPTGIPANSIINLSKANSTTNFSLDTVINKVDNSSGLTADLVYTDSKSPTPLSVTSSAVTSGASGGVSGYGGNLTVATGLNTSSTSFTGLTDGLITVTGVVRKTDNTAIGVAVTAGSFYKDTTAPTMTATFNTVPAGTAAAPTNAGSQLLTVGGFSGLKAADRSITVGGTTYNGKYDCWVDLADNPTGTNKISVAAAASLPASGTDTVSVTLPAKGDYTSGALLGTSLAGQVKLYCMVTDAAGNTSANYASSGWYVDFGAPTVSTISVTSTAPAAGYYDDN